ncbi:hypothetical protein V5N11_027779 [Cardamine amara subsp. amara]|uniref:No apical meristem-associated C-terminal domain-containing protein n=1 Tax=Cardamine amara subsp. amara TaxID=228776 RepID=A0ABD1A690_CARAN
MSTILTACSKLRGCINHVENKNPSSASQEDIVNQAKMLLTQEANYSKGFKFYHVWHILRGIEKLANKQITRVAASQEESETDFSSPSLQDESSPTPGMNSFDLNTSGEEGNFSKSRRPMGVKKAKRKQQCDDQFKKMMEQNERLIKAIAKGTSERNEIQRKKVEVQRMKEENKILFADLNSITDQTCREYIQNQRVLIMSRGVQTTQHEEPVEGSRSQYRASRHQNDYTQITGEGSHSQYRAFCYQNDQTQGDNDEGQQTQGEDEISPSDHQDMSKYYDLLSRTGSYFPRF